MQKLLILFLALAAFQVQAKTQGGQEGNGGDICENRIQTIASDIKEWVNLGGSNKLVLPSGISLNQYNTQMQNYIATANIVCISDKIFIGGLEKTCDNSLTLTGSTQIRCNFERFNNTTESDQYVLIHHEYAGLANLEVNTGSASNYEISNQISGFLQDVVVKKLAIKPNDFIDICGRSEFIRLAIEEATRKPCNGITSHDLASIEALEIWNPIDYANRSDLSGLTGLKSIEININFDLPGNFFDHVPLLTTLIIRTIKPKLNLDENLLKNLSVLESFTLNTYNFDDSRAVTLTYIPANFFHRNQNLKFINFDWVTTTSLSVHVFSGLTSLQVLQLGFKNTFVYFDSILFKDLVNLESLKLGYLKNPSIEPGAFSNLKKLRTIKINGDDTITGFNLPQNLLSGLNLLTNIELSGFWFPSIPDGFFKDQTNLELLSIIGCTILNISENVFSSNVFSSTANVSMNKNSVSELHRAILISQLGTRWWLEY